MQKVVLSLFASVLLTGCMSQSQPKISESEVFSRLNRLENWEEHEYQKAAKRDEERYQVHRGRRIDALEDQKLALENERIHYQNKAIEYQSTRQRTKDMIDDIGQIQMNRAKAINKAYENMSKQQDIYIIK